MHMISSTLRSKTRTISIDATPDAVLNVVADPYRLPSWAPNFARAVRPAGDDWLIQSVGAEALITVRVSRDQGTLDLLAARDHRRGAFSRVLPNGDGSEYIFTLFFSRGTEETAIAAQMAIVDVELQTVRSLSENPNSSNHAG